MALKATIFKAELQISDMDRHYYATHALTIARHPSETDERMMVRVLAFGLFAAEDLSFTRGISDTDEPDLWRKDLTGAIEQWIEIGQPDERRLLKAAGKAREVVVLCFGDHGARLWWEGVAKPLERVKNLKVINLPAAASQALARLAQRTMTLQCTVQEGQVWLGDGAASVEVPLTTWRDFAGR